MKVGSDVVRASYELLCSATAHCDWARRKAVAQVRRRRSHPHLGGILLSRSFNLSSCTSSDDDYNDYSDDCSACVASKKCSRHIRLTRRSQHSAIDAMSVTAVRCITLDAFVEQPANQLFQDTNHYRRTTTPVAIFLSRKAKPFLLPQSAHWRLWNGV
jgi:hypothetical protein